MATVTKPIALDESFNTTEVTPRNIADVLAEGLSHITGRTASEVEYDNTDSGLTADDVQGAIDELSERPTLPTTDIQTAVDEFSTYNGGILDSLKVALSSIQDLHGYAEPWVGGSKKNKLPLVLADIKTDNTAGTWSGNKYTNNGVEWEIVTDEDGNVTEIVANNLATGNSVLYVKRKPQLEENTNYILNGCPANGSNSTYRMAYSNQVNQDYSDTGNGVTFQKFDYVTYPNSAVFCVVYNGYTANNIKFKPMARLATESDPTFAPYSNICPISGHTQVDVDISDGQTTQEQVTVNLGGTYYSGTLDVVTGEFVATQKSIGASDFDTFVTNPSAGGLYYAQIDTSGSKANGNGICNMAKVDNLNAWIYTYPVAQIAPSQAGRIRFYCESTSMNEFLSQYANLQIVFELDTPLTIQLSPTMVKALVGENHLDAPLEGQDITESKYRELFTWDEVEAYVNAHSGGGSGMNYSTNEQVIGTWIDSKPLYQKTIDFGALPNGNTKDLSHGIANIDKVWISGGFAYQPNGDFANQLSLCVPSSLSAGWYFGVNSSIVRCETASDRTNYSAYVTIQYTKTTD